MFRAKHFPLFFYDFFNKNVSRETFLLKKVLCETIYSVSHLFVFSVNLLK